MVEHLPGVYSYQMFNPSFCDLLAEEISNYEKTDLVKSRPNSMNNYGGNLNLYYLLTRKVILNDIGMEGMFDLLLDLFRPMLRLLFPEFGGGTVDHHHSFSVHYTVCIFLALSQCICSQRRINTLICILTILR